MGKGVRQRPFRRWVKRWFSSWINKEANSPQEMQRLLVALERMQATLGRIEIQRRKR